MSLNFLPHVRKSMGTLIWYTLTFRGIEAFYENPEAGMDHAAEIEELQEAIITYQEESYVWQERLDDTWLKARKYSFFSLSIHSFDILLHSRTIY